MDDYMEIGDTGWVLLDEGWLYNKNSGRKRDPEGREFNEAGELVYDPEDKDGG